MWLIIFIVYILLTLINTGIFYAWNPFNIWEDDDYKCKSVLIGVVFPLVWAVIIARGIFTIPFCIVDFFKEGR
jgi:hypothetical protein